MQNTPSQPRLPPRRSTPPQPPTPTKKRSRKIKFWSLVGLIIAGVASLVVIVQFFGIPTVPAGIAMVESWFYHPTPTPVVRPSTKFPPLGTTLDTYSGYEGAVDAITWSPDGQSIAFGGDSSTVIVWNITTKQYHKYQGHKSKVTAVSWSPDGQLIASGDTDGTVQVWVASTGKPFQAPDDSNAPVTAIAWSPDICSIAVGYEDGSVKIFGGVCTQRGYYPSKVVKPSAGSGAVKTIVWSADSVTFAVASYPATVRVYDHYGDINSTLSIGGEPLMLDGGVIALSLSPNGKLLALSYQPPIGNTGRVSLKVWDITKIRGNIDLTDTSYALFVTGSWFVESMSWACDSSHLAVADIFNNVNLYNVTTNKTETTYTNRVSGASVAWSPDGTRIASASGDRVVRVWQASEDTLCSAD